MLFETVSLSYSLIILNLCLGFITSFFVPERYKITSCKWDSIQPGSNVDNLFAEINDLSPKNGHYIQELIFERENINVPLHNPIQYKATIMYSTIKDNDARDSLSGTIYPVIPTRKSTTTGPYRLLMSNKITQKKVTTYVTILNVCKNIKSISLVTKVRDDLYNIFTILHRLFFFVIVLLNIRFVLKVRANKSDFIHVILYYLMLFALNPLALLNYYSPSNALIVIDNLAQALFESYFRIYLILYMSQMRKSVENQNEGSYNSSELPCFCFFIVMFIAKFMHYNNNELQYTDYMQTVSSQSNPLMAFELGIDMTYFTWFVVSFLSTLSKPKSSISETCFQSYLYIFGTVVVLELFSKLFSKPTPNMQISINGVTLDMILYWVSAYLILQAGFLRLDHQPNYYDMEGIEVESLPQFPTV